MLAQLLGLLERDLNGNLPFQPPDFLAAKADGNEAVSFWWRLAMQRRLRADVRFDGDICIRIGPRRCIPNFP